MFIRPTWRFRRLQGKDSTFFQILLKVWVLVGPRRSSPWTSHSAVASARPTYRWKNCEERFVHHVPTETVRLAMDLLQKLTSEKSDSLGPKLSALQLWDCLGGQVKQPPWIMTRHASCCVPLCTNNFRNSPETFHFAFRHVCLHSHPTNNPINARAPGLGPGVSLFTEVSYSLPLPWPIPLPLPKYSDRVISVAVIMAVVSQCIFLLAFVVL